MRVLSASHGERQNRKPRREERAGDHPVLSLRDDSRRVQKGAQPRRVREAQGRGHPCYDPKFGVKHSELEILGSTSSSRATAERQAGSENESGARSNFANAVRTRGLLEAAIRQCHEAGSVPQRILKRTQSHAYCSTCDSWHRVDQSGPCEACWTVRCKNCGENSLITKSEKCTICKKPLELSNDERKYMTHPKAMNVCPKCHRKCRKNPRDKRRSAGLKKSDEKLPLVLEWFEPPRISLPEFTSMQLVVQPRKPSTK